MNYNIKTTKNFEKEAKDLVNKHKAIKKELINIIEEFERNLILGEHLENDVYKIRTSTLRKPHEKVSSINLTILIKLIDNKTVYLVSIFLNNKKNVISDKEIKQIYKSYFD